jgi:hypothetical protein
MMGRKLQHKCSSRKPPKLFDLNYEPRARIKTYKTAWKDKQNDQDQQGAYFYWYLAVITHCFSLSFTRYLGHQS